MIKGKSVVITRPAQQAEELVEIIKKLGGQPCVASTVEIVPTSDLESVRKLFKLIADGKSDIIVFMSQNGVTSFFSLSKKLKLEDKVLEALAKMQVVAIGVKTKTKLIGQGIRVDVTPADHSSNGLVATLSKIPLRGKVLVVPRTDSPTDYLEKGLTGTGVKIVQFPIYETRIPSDKTEIYALIKDILAGRIDIITFTSSSTALNLFKVAKELHQVEELREALNQKVVVVSIGPVTKNTLEGKGVKVLVTPNEYTVEAMMIELERCPLISPEKDVLDEVDLSILELVQKEIPLIKKPWAEIALRLGMSSEDVLKRLKDLKEKGVIRRIGPIIDARKVGLKASTLIGMRVSPNRINEVVSIINRYDEISHNYERKHEYNVWFTLTAPTQKKLDRIVHDIKRKTKVSEDDVVNLPTERLFKIRGGIKLR